MASFGLPTLMRAAPSHTIPPFNPFMLLIQKIKKAKRLTSIALALSLGLFSSCHQETTPSIAVPQQAASSQRPPGAILSQDHDGTLHFDERYLDSQDVRPQSARIQRELAIQTQLRRLSLVQRDSANHPERWATIPSISKDSVFEHVNGGPLLGYSNERAHLADIYRKIDSLKVLEHISLTPHPFLQKP